MDGPPGTPVNLGDFQSPGNFRSLVSFRSPVNFLGSGSGLGPGNGSGLGSGFGPGTGFDSETGSDCGCGSGCGAHFEDDWNIGSGTGPGIEAFPADRCHQMSYLKTCSTHCPKLPLGIRSHRTSCCSC